MMNSILIDTHAHVWDRSCALVPGARYRPDYEATIDTYLGVLDAHGIERAVLVQPSFLGTDNRYLLDCLRAYPDRLRGIVVISEDATSEEIEDMRSVGVIGMRFNLIGRDASVMKSKPAGELVDRVVQQNWFVEVHVDGEYLSDVLTVLKSHRAKVIVDHFGRPSDDNCPGHMALLGATPSQFLIKFSAPYRQRMKNVSEHARRLVNRFGPERCLWGSDWPWTQYEELFEFRRTIEWSKDWIANDEADRFSEFSASFF